MSTRFVPLLLSLFWIACSDRQDANPFDSLLQQPPYASWTQQIEKDPKNDSLYYQRARLLFENQQSEPALLDLKKAWSLRPTPDYALARLELLEGSPATQFQFLQEAQRKFPNNFLLELSQATLLNQTGSVDSALSITTRWIQAGQSEAELFLLHAALLDKKGNSFEAIRVLEILHSHLPQDHELAEMLALRYAESGNPKIFPLCERLQQLDSMGRDATPHYYLGIYYANKKQRSEAVQAFDRAIQADHNFIDAYIEKASLLFESNAYLQAAQVLDKALLIAPDHAPVYYWTAKCQQALGDRESAKLNYLKAYGLDNSFLEAKRAADELK